MNLKCRPPGVGPSFKLGPGGAAQRRPAATRIKPKPEPGSARRVARLRCPGRPARLGPGAALRLANGHAARPGGQGQKPATRDSEI